MKLSTYLVELILRRNSKDGFKIFTRLKDIAIYARYPIFNSEQRKYESCTAAPCWESRKSFSQLTLFYLYLPMSRGQVWASGKKPYQPTIEPLTKFLRRIMVSAWVLGIFYTGPARRLHFVAKKAKINIKYYEKLLSLLLFN